MALNDARLRGLLQNQPPLEGKGRYAGRVERNDESQAGALAGRAQGPGKGCLHKTRWRGGSPQSRTCMQILVTRAKMRHASVQRRTKRRGCAVSCPSVDCEEIAVCSYTFEDGSSYEGMWKNFLPHGEGTYTWPGGTVYTVCSFSSSNLPFSRHKLVCAEFLPRVKLSGRN